MTTVGTVIASVSRNAGGLFESVCELSLEVNRQGSFENEIFGLEDDYAAVDKGAWKPLKVELAKVHGPRAFGFSPDLYQKLTNANVDIIHSHGIWMYPSVAVTRVAQQRSIPYVVSPHGMLDPWAVKNSRWKKRFAHVLYEKDHLNGAACLRALCESEARAMRAFGLKNPICVIPNGVGLPDEASAVPPSWINQVPVGKNILLYLGRIHPKKGLPDLLQAWARLVNNHVAETDAWQLVIAGWDQGSHQRELMALADKLGISRSVSFVGPQFNEAKHASYSYADAFILPSFSEGLPMAVLEAWSYRLPVLMTLECNLPEGFQSDAAIEIQASADDIVSGLKQLFTLSETERANMGVRGRNLVEKEFSWPEIGMDMVRVYKWILEGGSAPSCILR